MSLTSTSRGSGLSVLSGVAGLAGLSDLEIHDTPRPGAGMPEQMKHGPTAQHTQQDGH
ncbi:hypothetical protein IMCC26207_10677 [Actinobacteria bacterium IMCC26207]|nr:hypothetical protein IMCC26207_10677 [Actinobacteria bacterium IMCC26207]